MESDHSKGRSSNRSFTTTHWSIVLAAGEGDAARARPAMERLCRDYWYPLYAYVRRRGTSAHDAQDLTQAFFAEILRRHDLAQVRREKGRFRSFLLASLQHFLANEWKKARRLKRGRGQTLISIDQAAAESRYAVEPAHELSADKLYDRRWALTLLERALERLREEHADKSAQFQALKVHLGGVEGGPAYAQLAVQLGLSEGAVKMAISRLRRRYREILRDEIAQTVATPDDIDDEIRQLFAALG